MLTKKIILLVFGREPLPNIQGFFGNETHTQTCLIYIFSNVIMSLKTNKFINQIFSQINTKLVWRIDGSWDILYSMFIYVVMEFIEDNKIKYLNNNCWNMWNRVPSNWQMLVWFLEYNLFAPIIWTINFPISRLKCPLFRLTWLQKVWYRYR